MLRRFLPVLLACLLALLLAAGPAQAAATTFRVSPLGVYVSPNAGIIHGNVTCNTGPWTLEFVKLRSTPYDVNGTVAGVCDGTTQPWEATIVGGPYAPGGAIIFGARLVADGITVVQVPKVVLQ